MQVSHLQVLSIGERSHLNRAFRKFNLSSLKNAVPCLPSLVGKTQSNISNPFATDKEISLKEPIHIKYLGLFIGKNFGT